MKTNKLNISLLTLALLVPFVTSCGESNDIDAMLAKLEKGFTLNGVVTQEREMFTVNNNGQLEPSGERESQEYKVEVLYENSSERTGASITHTGQLGDVESTIDQIYAYVDEQGYCYKEFLDYKNEVQKVYINEYGNKLNYGSAGLYNFATILNSSDFTYQEQQDVYSVNIDKIAIIAKNILGHVNSGFMYTPIIANLTIKNGMFDTLDIVIEEYGVRGFEDNQYIEVKYNNSVQFKFDKVMETKIPRVTPFEAKPQNAELRSALDKIGNNFSMEIESQLSIDKGAVNKKYRDYKFDGERILIHDYATRSEGMTLNANNHFILQKLEGSQNESLYSYVYSDQTHTYTKKEHAKFAKNYQGAYYYEDIIPEVKVISSDLFDYDSDVNEYICADFDVVDVLKKKLTITRAPLADEHIQNAFKIGIRLTDNGDLDYIKFYVNYKNLFTGSDVEGFIKESFYKIGSTKI